jgi:hypothetical protein
MAEACVPVKMENGAAGASQLANEHRRNVAV